MMTFSIFALPAIALSASVIEVPIVPGYAGRPSVQVAIHGVDPLNHTLAIGFESDTRFSGDRISRDDLNISFAGYDHISFPIGPLNHMIFHERSDAGSVLGIGGHSTLLYHFESVTIIQNATQPVILAIGAPREYFEARCFADTLSEAWYQFNTLYGYVQYGDEMGYVAPSDHNEIALSSRSQSSPIYIGPSEYDHVYQRFAETGAVLVDSQRAYQFANCTYIPESLDLYINFRNGNPQRAARIFVSRFEYIDHDTETNTCTVPISYQTALNPFRLPGLNVRIAPRSGYHIGALQFCESSF